MKPAPKPSLIRLCAHVLLIGLSRALNITVPMEPVEGVVGDSVLLPVTYSVPQPPAMLQITWSHENSIVLFSEMTLSGSGEPPALAIRNEYHIVVGRFQRRVVFYPENASLLLRNIQLNDSGLYTVTFQELNQSRSMVLVVHGPQSACRDPDSTKHSHDEEEKGPHLVHPLAVRGTCAAIFILVIIGLHCARRRQVCVLQCHVSTAKKCQTEVL
ncbi:HEPACAM family member 2-like isoform X1 [Ranitomeya variabilis]|uniref:HEPACAM family member 2-like isoform X1 n=1 Tax=Ranitomeya variabilis TaxID=490064 RepID=UPI004057B7F3